MSDTEDSSLWEMHHAATAVADESLINGRQVTSSQRTMERSSMGRAEQRQRRGINLIYGIKRGTKLHQKYVGSGPSVRPVSQCITADSRKRSVISACRIQRRRTEQIRRLQIGIDLSLASSSCDIAI